MIDKSGYAVSIDHVFAIHQSEKISSWRVLVDIVSLRVSQPRTGVFNDDCAFLDWRGCIDAIGMNLGLPDNQGHLPRLALRSEAVTTCGASRLSSAISLLTRRLNRRLISRHHSAHDRALLIVA